MVMHFIFVLLLTFVSLSTTHLVNNVVKTGIGSPAGVFHTRIPNVEYFSQKLDHFDPTNQKTWNQRYWRNSLYYKPGSPVFLMINGEAPCDGKWAVEGQWISYAEENNALCFLVEHRFYGGSRPLNDTSSENLKFLSSEQALADLAYFVEGINENFDLSHDTKWIVFGGSYAGSLAAWMRIKYPHLVHGAVSSSGPLLAKIDFYEYFEIVQKSLAAYKLECPIEIRKANKQLSSLITTKSGRSEIQKLFNLCEPLDDDSDDVANLFENLSGNFADVVQYNKDNRESNTKNVTINVLCDIMTDEDVESSGKSSLDRYADVNALSLMINNVKCLSHKYVKYIEELRKTDWESASKTGRQWIYQTCTEFGFYQTSSKPSDIFGRYFPIEFFVKQCREIFGSGFNDDLLKNAVSRTNILYGALNVNVENIIFIHGSIDPWHVLGLVDKRSESVFETIFIKGTAHCADMYPSSPEDNALLKRARAKIRRIIRSWVSSGNFTLEDHSKRTWEINVKIKPREKYGGANFV